MGITIVVVMRIHIGMVMARMRYISLCRALLLMLSSTWHLLAPIMFDEDSTTRSYLIIGSAVNVLWNLACIACLAP